MLPEKTENTQAAQESPDLFAEPRDHANQWDVSAFAREPENHPHKTVENQIRPVVE